LLIAKVGAFTPLRPNLRGIIRRRVGQVYSIIALVVEGPIVAIINRVNHGRSNELLQIVNAGDSLALLFGSGE
jgi:hypothetical protein